MIDYLSFRLFERKARSLAATHPKHACGSASPKTHSLQLRKGRVIQIESMPTPLRIECQQGALWITETGIAKDTILTAGESFKARSQGRVVIEALETACIAQTPEADDTGQPEE